MLNCGGVGIATVAHRATIVHLAPAEGRATPNPPCGLIAVSPPAGTTAAQVPAEDPHPFDRGPPSLPSTQVVPTSVGSSSAQGETGAVSVVAGPPSDTPPSLTVSGGDHPPPPEGGLILPCPPWANRRPAGSQTCPRRLVSHEGTLALVDLWVTNIGRPYQHSPGSASGPCRPPIATSLITVGHNVFTWSVTP